MRRVSLALLCTALMFAAALSAAADRQKRSKRPVPRGAAASGQAVERDAGPDAWRDRDRCRVIVTEYYDRRSLPPGLAKKQKLPPGLRKQLRERGHLPPGLERHWVVLPVELERTLPPLPPHYVRRAVDNDLIVVDVRTNLVVSVMAGVFISR